jgi:hypothetical protein
MNRFLEEGLAAAVAALRHMMRKAGEDQAGQAGHKRGVVIWN